jgi:hypothetical protein
MQGVRAYLWKQEEYPLLASHELRNEIVEELISIRGAKAIQNWTLGP